MSDLSGVSTHTLRAWERRYEALTPSRSDSGQRKYSLDDLNRVKSLKRLIDSGFAISKIAGLKRDELQDLLKSIQVEAPQQVTTVDEVNLSTTTVSLPEEKIAAVNSLVSHLESWDLAAVNEDLTRARAKFNVREYVLELISPLMRETGQLVIDRKLTISQEHALSAIIREHLGQVTQSLRSSTKSSGCTFAFATTDGDLHEFGILLSHIICLSQGHKTLYFGPSLPASSLAEALLALKPTHLVLGVSGAPWLENTVTNYLNYLFERIEGIDTQVWIGGGGSHFIQSNKLKRSFDPVRDLYQFDMLCGKLSQ